MTFLFRLSTAVCAGVFAGGISLRAEEPALLLTLPAALQRTLDRNPSLAASIYAERAAEARIESAGLRPNPTLDVTLENFAGTGPRRGVNELEATVQASQTIERGDKRARRVALAGREKEAARQEFEVLRAEVLGGAALAYVEAQAAARRLALAAEAVALARETLAAVDARLKAAMASPAETARARSALALAEGVRARLAASDKAARAALAVYWAGDADEVSELAGSLPFPSELPDATALTARLDEHPRLALQHAVVSGNRAALDVERSLATQDVTIGGGVKFFRDGSDAAFVAGASVPLPFRNKNQGGIRAARETLAGAEQKTRALEIELRAAFAVTWSELRASHELATTLRRDALPAAEEASSLVRSAYDEGRLPLIDVIESRRALIEVRREILEAEAACAVALVKAETFVDAAYPLTTRFSRLP